MDEKNQTFTRALRPKQIAVIVIVVLLLGFALLFRSLANRGSSSLKAVPQDSETQKEYRPHDPLDSLHEIKPEPKPANKG
jgi:hypothetical protein